MVSWLTAGAAVWVVGGLIASRIMLFKLQDSQGRMKAYGSGHYDRSGWPLFVGLAWPILIPAAAICYGLYRLFGVVGTGLRPAISWWYTKPSVRKLHRHGVK